MKDFSGYSDDELLDELDYLSLEISCMLGTKRGNTLEKIYWLAMGELERRGVNPITGEVEHCVEGDYEDDYVSSEGDEIEDEGLRDNLGRDYESFDNYDDLPF